MHSRMERPVVTMSSTTSTFSPLCKLEAAAELEAPSTRSV